MMTITRLSLATAFLVGAGLAAWGAVGFAADGSDREPQAAVTASAPAPTLLAKADADAEPDPQPATRREEPIKPTKLNIPEDLPPVVVAIEPKLGATDVDPGLKEIRVTFSKKMTDQTWSWTEGTRYSVPKLNGKIHYEPDQRTCVMPVMLEPGKTYVLGINSERHRNFQDAQGHSALPYLVVFRTKGAR